MPLLWMPGQRTRTCPRVCSCLPTAMALSPRRSASNSTAHRSASAYVANVSRYMPTTAWSRLCTSKGRGGSRCPLRGQCWRRSADALFVIPAKAGLRRQYAEANSRAANGPKGARQESRVIRFQSEESLRSPAVGGQLSKQSFHAAARPEPVTSQGFHSLRRASYLRSKASVPLRGLGHLRAKAYTRLRRACHF